MTFGDRKSLWPEFTYRLKIERSTGIVLSVSIVCLLVWVYLSRVLLDLLHTRLGSIPKIK